jgi:hypothetical protein
MNERIKELARQAKEETDTLWAKLTPQEFKDTYNQKFAELIVQECIWALWTEECRTSDLASEEYTRGSNKINDHFWG